MHRLFIRDREMKKYIFIVTLITGVTFTQEGRGYNMDSALMDACEHLAADGNYPEDEIFDVNFDHMA